MIKWCIPVLLLTLFSCQSSESTDEYSKYHTPRFGLKNSAWKFENNPSAKVAFLGGSITYNSGWRDSVVLYLKTRFPSTEFEFINAGIPSMGSTPGAFRMERDVLSKGPIDLLFEEAAVNDATNGRNTLEQELAMEGIIRRARLANPTIDIVLMHFVDPQKMEEYNSGKIPEVIMSHEKIADHYDLPSINLALEVTERINRQEFDWENDFINLHPSPFGQGVYARSIIHLLEKQYAITDEMISEYSLPAPLHTNSYHSGKLIDIRNSTFTGDWEIQHWKAPDGEGTRAGYTDVEMLIGGNEGSVRLNFEGTAVGIAVAAGPDAGMIEYRIDSGDWKTQDLFTKWSTHLHLPWYYVLENELVNTDHNLEIRISDECNEGSNGSTCRIKYFFVNENEKPDTIIYSN